MTTTITLVHTRDGEGSHYHAFRAEAGALEFAAAWLESRKPARGKNVSHELMRRITDRQPERSYSIRIYTLELQ